MYSIVQPVNVTFKCLGKQKIDAKKRYRLIQFCIKFFVDSGTILYNSLTGEIVLLNNEEEQLLDCLDTQNNTVSYLIEHWFIVPEENDDILLNDQLNTILRLTVDELNTDAITSFTILPTTDCNARCFYCYELSSSRISMTPKLAEDVAEYIIKVSKNKPIKIRWFGGEPLYNVEAINIICKILAKKNVIYTSSMVSNAYLFDEKNIKRAKDLWNLKNVQITLDGTEKVYNKCKAYIYKDDNAFVKVLNNIEKLLEAEIYVNVRMNVDDHNIKDIYILIDLLEKKFGEYKKFSAYAHLLFEDSTKKQLERSEIERHMLMTEFMKLEDYLLEKRLNRPRPAENMVRYKHCMADSNQSVMILPDGNLGKCEHYIESEFFGNIYSDKKDFNIINKFKQIRPFSTYCDVCQLRPKCMVLEMCPSVPRRCDSYDRKMYMRYIRQRVMASYDDFKKKTN